MDEMTQKAITNTRETIAICDEGLALDKDHTYYDADKRAFVVQVRREAVARLANLEATAHATHAEFVRECESCQYRDQQMAGLAAAGATKRVTRASRRYGARR